MGARCTIVSGSCNPCEAVSACGRRCYNSSYEGCVWIKDQAVEGSHWVGTKAKDGYDCFVAPIARAVKSTAANTADYIKAHWKHLLAYIFAWGVIVVLSGSMYGFQTVALPLTIGIACGLALGILTGILTATVFDRKNERQDHNTLWGILNLGIDFLDANGTKNFLTALVVSVTIAASVIFPYAIGAVFGLFLGNYLATKIGLWDREADDAKKAAEQEMWDMGVVNQEKMNKFAFREIMALRKEVAALRAAQHNPIRHDESEKTEIGS